MEQPGWSGGLGRINTETGGVRDLAGRRKEKEAAGRERAECRKRLRPKEPGSSRRGETSWQRDWSLRRVRGSRVEFLGAKGE